MNLDKVIKVKQRIDEHMKVNYSLSFTPSTIFSYAKELDLSYDDVDKALFILDVELSHEYEIDSEIILSHPSFLTTIPFAIDDIQHAIENGGLYSNGDVEVDPQDVAIHHIYTIRNSK